MKCALLIMLGMALASGPLRAATSDHPPHGGSLAEALAGHRLDQAMLRPDFAEAAPSAAPAPSSDVYCCDYLTESHDYLGSDDVHDGALVSDVVAPTWTVRTGAVFLERTRPRRRVVLDIMQGQFRGWTDEYNFDVEAGPDVTITRWLTDRAGFELRYFGSMQWEDEQTWQTGQWWIIATKPFISAFQLSGVATGSPLSSRYASQLHSTEVNYREAPNQTISYLVGFRWIELHEDLHLAADTGNNPTELDWDVDNHLYGGQLGAEINVFDRGGPTSALVWFKGGVYGNDANNDFTHLRAPAYGNVSRDNRKGQLAFVGDIALTGSCQLTRHVALRGGYQMLLAQGVALGSENLAATNPYTGVGIDASGFVFYHGALASVDFAW